MKLLEILWERKRRPTIVGTCENCGAMHITRIKLDGQINDTTTLVFTTYDLDHIRRYGDKMRSWQKKFDAVRRKNEIYKNGESRNDEWLKKHPKPEN